MMDIREEIEKRTRETEAIIRARLPEADGYQRTVIEAMNYSMLAGGKRLRPILDENEFDTALLKSSIIETLGLGDGAWPFMAAIEMIHTYSLVPDDLPAMDNDEFRRGKKTTHVVYGEAMAILAGDALLNYAYETALCAFDLEPENSGIPKALQILARKAGIYGMVGGQAVDIGPEGGCDMTREKLKIMYRLKTGALLESAMLTAREACTELARRTRSEEVQVIGTKFVLYRRHYDKSKRKIELIQEKKKTKPLT